MHQGFTSLAFPVVNFGTLEDLLSELDADRRAGKQIQSIRVTTNVLTRTGHAGETITDIHLLVTALTCDHAGFLQYSLWGWYLDSYAEIGDRPLSDWCRKDSERLVNEVLYSIKGLIQQELGITPKHGMYCLPGEWLRITGGTHLLHLGQLRTFVRPASGQRAQRLPSSTDTLVLGNIIDGVFHELEVSTLTSDERIRLVSPDMIHQWFLYPDGYPCALASRSQAPEQPPVYEILYDPAHG